MNWLLDTCVVSEFVKPLPDQRVFSWLRTTAEGDIGLSVVTMAELLFGVGRMDDGRRKLRLVKWIESDLAARFSGRILSVDLEVAREWSRIRIDAERVGRPLGQADALIAATALHHGLTLVTRNVRDFEATEVRIYNPWSETYPER